MHEAPFKLLALVSRVLQVGMNACAMLLWRLLKDRRLPVLQERSHRTLNAECRHQRGASTVVATMSIGVAKGHAGHPV